MELFLAALAFAMIVIVILQLREIKKQGDLNDGLRDAMRELHEAMQKADEEWEKAVEHMKADHAQELTDQAVAWNEEVAAKDVEIDRLIGSSSVLTRKKGESHGEWLMRLKRMISVIERKIDYEEGVET